MDCDSEVMVKLLYPDGVPEKCRDDPLFYSYVMKLGTFSVELLSKEPDHISSEKAAIINQTQDVAFNNYKTFIHTAECSRKIFQEFGNAEKALDSLIGKVPKFATSCEDFLNFAKEIKAQRKLNSVCLSKHSSVLQVLEALQLMETVIKEGMYEEALQLAAFVRRMAKTHPNIKILQDMVSEVDGTWWLLVSRLVGKLRTELQLPACLQLMGHLRRMDVLSPSELRIKFLQARDHWFKSQLASIPNEDPAIHLSKVIELSRTYLFNIITQYKAVFSDDDMNLTSNKQQYLSEIPILQAWVIDKVGEFVEILEKDLSAGVGTALPSLLNQAMYFGQSLSRVGCDIRHLIVPPFLMMISVSFDSEISKAGTQFAQDMAKFQLTNANPLIYKTSDDGKSSQLAPPRSLLEFYPLSYCCNNFLSGFNMLTSCAPLALAPSVTIQIQDNLLSVSQAIFEFYQREQQAMTEDEKKLFSKMCSCFSESFLPYIQHCLHTIFPPSEICSFIGIPEEQIKNEKVTYLQMELILAPINHLLPPKARIITSIKPPEFSDNKSSFDEKLCDSDIIPIEENIERSEALPVEPEKNLGPEN